MRTTRRRLTTTTAAAAGLALALAGCAGQAEAGADSPSAATSTEETQAAQGTHNDADTRFAQMMIVHHQGAIEMAELVAEEAGTDEVRSLAERIAAAQDPEIDLMSGWLEEWGEEQPDGMDMGDMDHGGMDMEGMDQEQVMEELGQLEGVELDQRFLELMADHHAGAIEMSQEQLDEGENTDALDLAQKIIDDQTVEIAEMKDLLGGM